jgi:5,5'-dehydrodivanillate O-demethylase
MAVSVEENRLLTQVGKGTPMGELLRRYWWPIIGSGALREKPVHGVRILGEDLTLFQDKSGRLGLIGQRCPHRRVDMKLGFPDEHGLRCMYHGWGFDTEGKCYDMPVEPEDSTFKSKVSIDAYPVEELGGLVWAYLGPQPAPLLPRWDILVWENSFRHVGWCVLDANWVQCMENSVDTLHTEYNHGYWTEYTVFDRMGGTGDEEHDASVRRIVEGFKKKHLKSDWKANEYGIQKYRLREGDDEAIAPDWQLGHPLVFPYMVRLAGTIRNEFQIRVPVDDEHTLHLEYFSYCPGPDVKVPAQEYVPYFEHPIFDEKGEPIVDYVIAQDMAAWWGQGAITDRENERLGVSDKGLIMYRQMLFEQMKVVADGGDPINTFRDPAKNDRIDLPVNIVPGPVAKVSEGVKHDLGTISFSDSLFLKYHQVDRYSPVHDQILDIYRRYDEARLGVSK